MHFSTTSILPFLSALTLTLNAASSTPIASPNTLASLKKAPKNLLLNPGFEDGVLAPWVQVSNGDPVVLENGDGLPGAETPYGDYFLSVLVASNLPSAFSQPLSLHKSRTYTASYALKTLLWNAASANFSISYAGEQIDQIAVSPDTWRNFTTTFVPCEKVGNFTFEFVVGGGSVIFAVDAFGVGLAK